MDDVSVLMVHLVLLHLTFWKNSQQCCQKYEIQDILNIRKVFEIFRFQTTLGISQIGHFQGTCIQSVSSEAEISRTGSGQFILQEEK